jgi:hypothetical protein
MSQRSLESVPGLFAIDLEVWDKQTGKELLSARDVATQSPLYQYEVDLAQRRLRFATYNFELEVRPKQAAQAPRAAADSAEESSGEKAIEPEH